MHLPPTFMNRLEVLLCGVDKLLARIEDWSISRNSDGSKLRFLNKLFHCFANVDLGIVVYKNEVSVISLLRLVSIACKTFNVVLDFIRSNGSASSKYYIHSSARKCAYKWHREVFIISFNISLSPSLSPTKELISACINREFIHKN